MDSAVCRALLGQHGAGALVAVVVAPQRQVDLGCGQQALQLRSQRSLTGQSGSVLLLFTGLSAVAVE